VAAQDKAVGAGILADSRFNQQGELESRTLPGHPDDAPVKPAVEFLQLAFTVGAGRECDRPVGMQMIDPHG
jgi:hypothetical protein